MLWQTALTGIGILLAYSMLSGPKNVVNVNGYSVQDLPDKEKAAEMLAEIRTRLTKLHEHYQSTPALAADPPVARFIARFQPDVFVENDMHSGDTSYSENKGQRIVVCLRDKTKKPDYPLVDMNTVMFVMLHEMAHLMTETIGHTQEFWSNFRRILQDAVQLGIYNQVNYAHTPVSYCGMQITDSPL